MPRFWLIAGVALITLPFIAVGKSELDPCQLIKLAQAESLIGKSLVQNAGELPSQNGIQSKSCFYSNKDFSNRPGSAPAKQFLEVTISSFASTELAIQTITALKDQMVKAIQSGNQSPKMKGARVLAVTGFGKNAFILEIPIPSNPQQPKPLVTRLYWQKDRVQIEVMAWGLNPTPSSLEITTKAAQLIGKNLP